MANLFLALAGFVLIIHFLFNGWVVFGAAITNGRPTLERLHLISLFYGAIMENVSWPCPLTVAQKWCLLEAGKMPYRGAFLIHYLQSLVSPDFPLDLLRWGAIAVLLVNLVIYLRRRVRRYGEQQSHAFHHE